MSTATETKPKPTVSAPKETVKRKFYQTTVERDNSQLDPEDQQQAEEAVSEVRARLKRFEASVGILKARLPYHSFLIKKQKVQDAIKEAAAELTALHKAAAAL